MTPYQGFYGHKCRTPSCCLEAGENHFMGPKIVHQTAVKLRVIRDRMLAAQDHQKSFGDKKRRLMTFDVGDSALLKVSPWKGIIIFGKRWKLSPRFIRPFKVLQRIGNQAYKLDLPEDLDGIHNTLHVCYLMKFTREVPNIILLTELWMDEN